MKQTLADLCMKQVPNLLGYVWEDAQRLLAQANITQYVVMTTTPPGKRISGKLCVVRQCVKPEGLKIVIAAFPELEEHTPTDIAGGMETP